MPTRGGRDYGDSVIKLTSGGVVNGLLHAVRSADMKIQDKDLDDGSCSRAWADGGHPNLIVMAARMESFMCSIAAISANTRPPAIARSCNRSRSGNGISALCGVEQHVLMVQAGEC